VLCDDFNSYVCKYNRGLAGEATKLFHEIIGGSFAKLWKLAVPDFCFVNVNSEHIEEFYQLQPAFFRSPCFGSLFNDGVADVDEFYAKLSPASKSKFVNKINFFKIALFDIWIANEDRNFNNYNLLIDIEQENQFIPIDHDSIFNTGNLDKGLVLLSDNESLISTEITSRLFTKKEIQSQNLVSHVKEEYYICIENCKQNVDNILNDIPTGWNVNKEKYKTLFNEQLFNKQWVDDCFKHFHKLIQLKFLTT
jgi:hypothetical protein